MRGLRHTQTAPRTSSREAFEIHEGLSVQHDATPHMVRVLAFSTDLGVSTFAFYACSSQRA
jgi:hypothetical protein